jgi:hypothetical protein
MKVHARFDSLVTVAVLTAFALSLAGCNKPPETPAPKPEPKAAETEVTTSNSGTTTTFAPPAPEPKQESGAATPAQ